MKMKFCAIVFLFVGITLTNPIYAEDARKISGNLTENDGVSVKLNAGITYLYGYTLYKIGQTLTVSNIMYLIGFDVSQLKFPINCPAADFSIDVGFLRNFKITARLQKNIPYINGKMEDSDWGVWYMQGLPIATPSSLDVFSTSDAKLDLWRGNADLEYSYSGLKPFLIGAALGIKYSYYYYDITDADQYYPSYQKYQAYLPSSYSQHDIMNGPVINYTYSHWLANLQAIAGLNFENWNFIMKAGFLLGAYQDTDNHLLRYKILNGSGSLTGFSLSLSSEWKFADHWSLSAAFQNDYLSGKGSQKQTRYEDTSEGPKGFLGSIGQKIESLVLSGTFTVSYLF